MVLTRQYQEGLVLFSNLCNYFIYVFLDDKFVILSIDKVNFSFVFLKAAEKIRFLSLSPKPSVILLPLFFVKFPSFFVDKTFWVWYP
jgi:hypothetical protein